MGGPSKDGFVSEPGRGQQAHGLREPGLSGEAGQAEDTDVGSNQKSAWKQVVRTAFLQAGYVPGSLTRSPHNQGTHELEEGGDHTAEMEPLLQAPRPGTGVWSLQVRVQQERGRRGSEAKATITEEGLWGRKGPVTEVQRALRSEAQGPKQDPPAETGEPWGRLLRQPHPGGDLQRRRKGISRSSGQGTVRFPGREAGAAAGLWVSAQGGTSHPRC